MLTRGDFARAIAKLDLSHTDRAVALLWFYRQTQEFEERTASELAIDLHEESFPRPNVTRLAEDLRRSRFTIRGRRGGSFQIDVRRLDELNAAYASYLDIKTVVVSGSVLPENAVKGTRAYLEQMALQINGAYDYGFYDACAVLCRRLMESLLIELYISAKRHHEVQANGAFFMLDRLIAHVKQDKALSLSRNSPKTMDQVKQLGDTAAHDRTYITQKQDVDDLKAQYRRLISELLALSAIKT